MASFEKKLDGFLASAIDRRVIDGEAKDKLMHYARSDELNHKGWFSLSNSLGLLGMGIVCFGLVMIIAHNWGNISDLTKISSFLLLLVGSHVGGLLLAQRGYENMASGLHLLGAGLFIAGIGLMAQIFNLSSKTGESFLLWTVAIAPLAILLRNGPVALLAIVAFTIWGNIYGDASQGFLRMSNLGHFVFNPAICLAMVFGGMILREKKSDMASYMIVPGVIGVVCWAYALGFTHYWGRSMMSGGAAVLPIAMLAIAVGMAIILWRNNRLVPDVRHFILAMGSVVLVLVMMMVIPLIGVDVNMYTERYQFGFSRRLYFWPMLISVMSWVAYFVIAFWGVIYGALQHKRWMLNMSVMLVGVGVLTRFFDLMGSMLDTGVMFVVSGLLLFATGFVLEKWRRNLIANAKQGA